MKRILLLTVLLSAVCTAGFADIVTEEVTYEAEGTSMRGYLAYPQDAQDTMGVLVVHEWWGHNDYARKRAEMLAELGYTALAVDMYGDGKNTEHPKDAGAFAAEVMQDIRGVAKPRFLAALNLLRDHSTTDPGKMAAVGYCFGGATVLNMARLGVDLLGVVSFHGSLSTSTPAEEGMVKAKMLVLHGGADVMITEEQIEAFKNEMERAGAEYQFVVYEGAKHSFTNPAADAVAAQTDLPVGYDKEADAQSWERMKEFLQNLNEPQE